MAIFQPVHSQKNITKFGKLSKPIEKLPEYAADAPAVCLFDFGKHRIEYVERAERFLLVTERHFQIKILNQEGFEHADIEIPYYENGAQREKITSLKAITYNWEGGKVIKTKLDQRKIFSEEKNEHWRRKKFAMPNVREGSVIEVHYTAESPFLFNLDRWDFQRTIPVVYNKFRVLIPEYFTYRIQEKGYLPHARYDHEVVNISIPLANGIGGNSNFRYRANEYTWEYKDVEAFKTEAYTTSMRNYASAIEFELAAARSLSGKEEDYSRTWESFDQELNEHRFFAGQLEKLKFLEEDMAAIKEKGFDGKEGIHAAMEFVEQRMNWNGDKGIFSKQPFDRAYREGEGNSAEVNLILVAVLRELGYDAHPVILATRKHGKVFPNTPRFADYNYLVAGVRLAEDTLLADATVKGLLPGYLPWRCLNGDFRMIVDGKGHWVNYKPPVSRQLDIINGKLSSDGKVNGSVSSSSLGYASIDLLEGYRAAGSLEALQTEMSEESDFEVTGFSIVQPDSTRKEVKSEFKFSLDQNIEQVEDLLLLSPAFIAPMEENPFQAPERKYPVDFGYPWEETQIIQLELPEDYLIENLPETKMVKLGDGKGSFIYQVTQMGENQLQITKKISIKETMFYAEEYKPLQQFFDLLIEKENEQIVLKKK